jgi:hypothetical protein
MLSKLYGNGSCDVAAGAYRWEAIAVVAPSIEALLEWHNFYSVLATASATLLGAMFIVASFGGGPMTEDRAAGVRLFVTPTVIHLSAVVLGCALAMVPSLQMLSLGIWFGTGGMVGFVFSLIRAIRIRQRTLELVDHFWYAAVPTIAYLIMIAAAVMAVLIVDHALDVLALSMALLLVAGIRNAWDLLLFLVAQSRSPNE